MMVELYVREDGVPVCRLYEIDDSVVRILIDRDRSYYIDEQVWGFDSNNRQHQAKLIDTINPCILMA
jgi:hypothetical protein